MFWIVCFLQHIGKSFLSLRVAAIHE